jgi:hypothetical protein
LRSEEVSKKPETTVAVPASQGQTGVSIDASTRNAAGEIEPDNRVSRVEQRTRPVQEDALGHPAFRARDRCGHSLDTEFNVREAVSGGEALRDRRLSGSTSADDVHADARSGCHPSQASREHTDRAINISVASSGWSAPIGASGADL